MPSYSSEQVLALVTDSLLLPDSIKEALCHKIVSIHTDTAILDRIGTYLADEKHFIIEYLKDVVRHDESNMVATEVRAIMQRQYVRDLHYQEQEDSRTENIIDILQFI